jgi:uncharacterized Ntn-hydrolase superfamily protein
MTFAIVAADPAAGLVGIAQATAPMAVGSRCPHVLAGVGAACVQGNTHPGLALDALAALESGASPAAAIDRLAATDLHFPLRQIAIVAAGGAVAAHTGTDLTAWAGHVTDAGFAAMGNGLASADVVAAMVESWRSSTNPSFELRLVDALLAGCRAGGDVNGQNSAVLKVSEAGLAWPRTDLRIDWHPRNSTGKDAADMLHEHALRYVPMIPYYAARLADPQVPDFDMWQTQRRVGGVEALQLFSRLNTSPRTRP